MRALIMAALVLALLPDPATAKSNYKSHVRARGAGDRRCTPADVARFEAMLGGINRGEYRTDPRFQITVHYLGTSIVHGTCNVALRPAN